LRRNSKAGCVDARVHTLAKFLMELTLIEYSLMHIPPSKLAAASLAISMKVISITFYVYHYFNPFNTEFQKLT
jgi:hypothetical protein